MKIRYVLLLGICCNVFSFVAQTKVGTVDSKYILAYMPESKIVGEKTQAYGAKLDSSFNIKVMDYKTRLADYQKREKEMGVLEKKAFAKELTTLEDDIKKYQTNGKKLIQLKQNELLRPLYSKLSDAIQSVAKENKFTQILTLSGNEFAYIDNKFDITDLVFNKLGIPIPDSEEKK